MRECPTRQENRETEQIQQMFYMDEDQTILQTPLMDTEEDKMTKTLIGTRDNLNLQEVKMGLPHSCPSVKFRWK